jgi:hypothetical protein
MTASSGRTVGVKQWAVLLRIAMDHRHFVPVDEIVEDTIGMGTRQQMRRVVTSLWSCGLVCAPPDGTYHGTAEVTEVCLHPSAWDVRVRLRKDFDPNVQAKIDDMYRAARIRDRAA